MWYPPEQPWQYRLLDALPPGIDEGQLAEARALTPAERVARLEALNAAARAFRAAVRAVK